MDRRHWTLLLIADDRQTVRQVRIPKELVRLAIGGCLLVLAMLTSLSVGFFVKEGHRLRADRLEKENETLSHEVHEIRTRITTLQGTLEELSSRDEHYRLLAGLDPLDPGVRQAGIGGPGTETLQSSRLWRLDPNLGEATFTAASDLNTMLRRVRLLASSWNEATETLEEKHARFAATPSIMPVRGYLSSSFSKSRWHPILDRPRAHQGIDISAPRGAPIHAAAAGRITQASRNGNYGLMVEIDHGYGYVTRYAHASRIVVRPGQQVKRGEKIAEVGDTGLAVSPHLHYEVLVNGRHTDPRNFIFDDGVLPE
jgi:murein DD-endopeptidase MepM/ murein hydrolase activator NlpD